MYIYIHIHIDIDIDIDTCMIMYVCMYMYVYIYIYTHTYNTYTNIHTCMHAYIQTYIHNTYIHTDQLSRIRETNNKSRPDERTNMKTLRNDQNTIKRQSNNHEILINTESEMTKQQNMKWSRHTRVHEGAGEGASSAMCAIYTCMVYIYVCMYIYIYICICMYIQLSGAIYSIVNIHRLDITHILLCMCMYIYIYICMFVYT